MIHSEVFTSKKSQGTDIIVLLDRSGSMGSIKHTMETGFQEFLNKFKHIPNTFISLFQFDDVFEEVYTGRAAASAPPLHLQPRGMTALYDAIKRIKEYLDGVHKNKAMLIILTDGLENISKTSASEAKEIIQYLQNKGVEITYLGANQDAILSAQAIGIVQGKAMTWNPTKAFQTWGVVGQTVTAYASNATPVEYTKEDRTKVE